jgi:hypothetical protein
MKLWTLGIKKNFRPCHYFFGSMVALTQGGRAKAARWTSGE